MKKLAGNIPRLTLRMIPETTECDQFMCAHCHNIQDGPWLPTGLNHHQQPQRPGHQLQLFQYLTLKGKQKDEWRRPSAWHFYCIPEARHQRYQGGRGRDDQPGGQRAVGGGGEPDGRGQGHLRSFYHYWFLLTMTMPVSPHKVHDGTRCWVDAFTLGECTYCSVSGCRPLVASTTSSPGPSPAQAQPAHMLMNS